jgi:pSer/pThr/pTyr-binding forkhead associated (FHA) protein
VVNVQGHDRSLPGNRSYLVGRDPRCDIVVADDRVSWHHAALQPQGGRWVLVDNNSTNGTYVGGQRVARVEIGSECVARLGHPADGPVLSCTVTGTGEAGPGGSSAHPGTGAAAGDATDVLPAQRPTPEPAAPSPPPAGGTPPGGTLRIGRAPDNDIVVVDPGVSRYHAELRNVAGGYRIVDLASHNGTFVNGQRATDAPLYEGDVVGIGPARFRMAGQELRRLTGATTQAPPPRAEAPAPTPGPVVRTPAPPPSQPRIHHPRPPHRRLCPQAPRRSRRPRPPHPPIATPRPPPLPTAVHRSRSRTRSAGSCRTGSGSRTSTS